MQLLPAKQCSCYWLFSTLMGGCGQTILWPLRMITPSSLLYHTDIWPIMIAKG
jgi:hypothetical protein